MTDTSETEMLRLLGIVADQQRDITAMRGEIVRLREALNIAAGALWRLHPSVLDDDEHDRAEHVRNAGLEAAESALKRKLPR